MPRRNWQQKPMSQRHTAASASGKPFNNAPINFPVLLPRRKDLAAEHAYGANLQDMVS